MRIPTHGHPREILRARFLRLTSSPSDDLFYSVIFSHAVWSAVGMILSSVSQSVCLWRSVLWLKDTAQVSEQVTRKWPLWTRFYNFQLLHRPYPPNSPSPKFRYFADLLYSAFLITWLFCLCCYGPPSQFDTPRKESFPRPCLYGGSSIIMYAV